MILAVLIAATTSGAGLSSRYGGLGASVAAFYAQNPHGTSSPPLGVAYYRVDRKRNGRVIAYEVQINAQPPFSARERLALLGGINLPADATETNLNRTHCIVWRSRTLGSLIGMEYAAGTTDSTSNIAQMRVETRPNC
jgi:hypothetical protein